MKPSDVIKSKIKASAAAGTLPKPRDPAHPYDDATRKAVYQYIEAGHAPSSVRGRLVGATDAEIAIGLNFNANTVRWARWALSKAGFVKKYDHKRSARPGAPKLEVWVVCEEKIPLADREPLPQEWFETREESEAYDEAVTGDHNLIEGTVSDDPDVIDAEFTVRSNDDTEENDSGGC